MKKRTAFVASAVAAAIAAGGALAALDTGRARATAAPAISQQVTIPGTQISFAPPAANAAPALTPAQAWAKFASVAGESDTSISAGITVQLGLLTDPIGPYCGTDCDMWTVQKGIAYRALNKLAYGYSSWSSCQSGATTSATPCQDWWFLDANTGQLIAGALPDRASTAVPLRSPPAG